MKLKSKLRLALELGLVTSALPVLLLGCGGGGGGSSTSGMMSGQFWSDLTSTAGIRNFDAGDAASGIPAFGYVSTASFSSGSYIVTGTTHQMYASGVWHTENAVEIYYLANTAWTAYPATAITATDATHYSVTGSHGSSQGTITTINLSGMPIVASLAVPAIDDLGYASSVSPASTVYPAGSYEFDIAYTHSSMPTVYVLWVSPDFAVTTKTTPITNANFNAATFAEHTVTTDPICVFGIGLVYTGTGSTYNVYSLTGPATAVPTCNNENIAPGAPIRGTYDLTFTTVNTAPIVTFTHQSGDTGYGDYLLGLLSGTAYGGSIIPARASTSVTGYSLNKTAMDAALTAWGVPMF